jgi:hypothetical protein
MADRRPTPATPRWVWVGGIIAVIVLLMLIVLTVTGNGSHGPGRHLSAGGPSSMVGPVPDVGDPTSVRHRQG